MFINVEKGTNDDEIYIFQNNCPLYTIYKHFQCVYKYMAYVPCIDKTPFCSRPYFKNNYLTNNFEAFYSKVCHMCLCMLKQPNVEKGIILNIEKLLYTVSV